MKKTHILAIILVVAMLPFISLGQTRNNEKSKVAIPDDLLYVHIIGLVRSLGQISRPREETRQTILWSTYLPKKLQLTATEAFELKNVANSFSSELLVECRTSFVKREETSKKAQTLLYNAIPTKLDKLVTFVKKHTNVIRVPIQPLSSTPNGGYAFIFGTSFAEYEPNDGTVYGQTNTEVFIYAPEGSYARYEFVVVATMYNSQQSLTLEGGNEDVSLELPAVPGELHEMESRHDLYYCPQDFRPQQTTLLQQGGKLNGLSQNYQTPSYCALIDTVNSGDSDFVPYPTIQVEEVGFKGDHKITRYSNRTVIDPGDNMPTWKRVNNPNEPVAYTKGASPTLFVKFSLQPAVAVPTSAVMRVSSLEEVATVPVTLSGATLSVDPLPTNEYSIDLPVIKRGVYDLEWEFSFDGGQTFPSDGMAGTSTHTIYWLWAAPKRPTFLEPPIGSPNDLPGAYYFSLNGNDLFDESLKFIGDAIDTLPGGHGFSVSVIADKLNSYLAEKVNYRPNIEGTDDPAEIISLVNLNQSPAHAVCFDNAVVFNALVRSLGFSNPSGSGVGITFHWGGNPNNKKRRNYIYRPYPNSNRAAVVNMQVARPQLGNSTCNEYNEYENPVGECVSGNPHFVYHAVVKVVHSSGNATKVFSYDPSYGVTESSPVLIEAADPNGMPVVANAELYHVQSIYFTGDTEGSLVAECPHVSTFSGPQSVWSSNLGIGTIEESAFASSTSLAKEFSFVEIPNEKLSDIASRIKNSIRDDLSAAARTWQWELKFESIYTLETNGRDSFRQVWKGQKASATIKASNLDSPERAKEWLDSSVSKVAYGNVEKLSGVGDKAFIITTPDSPEVSISFVIGESLFRISASSKDAAMYFINHITEPYRKQAKPEEK
jgi:hypothetical protein